jgi:hypothetical protein
VSTQTSAPALSRRRRLAILAAAVSAVLAGTLALTAQHAAAATLFSADFESGASGWSKSGGTWIVTGDGSQTFQQTNTGTDRARQFAGSTSWRDYSVQGRVKPMAFAGSGSVAALASRAAGSTKMYRLALTGANRVELQYMNGSTASVLAAVSRPVTTGTWYTLRIDTAGNTITGYVDGTLVGTATNSAIATGRIGLFTGYASARFDDISVTDTTTPPPTSPPPTSSPPTSPSPTTPTQADTLIVATNGNDANPGTLGAPLATLSRAVELATPGTSIELRGGTYQFSTNVRIMKDGTSANPYTITNYNGEPVILDGENLPHTPAPVGGSIPNLERGVLHMEADYWRVRGLQIIHGPYAIFCRDCSNNIFDRLVTRDNYESGLQIQGAASNNQVINLDAFGNRDPRKNGESADGLAIKEGSGTGNVVRGARLWNNSDDGFDAWLFTSPILVENSAAWGNGFNRWNLPDYTGDGNGFKMGGGDPDPPANHTIRNSFAFDNAVGGFIDNGNPGTIVVDRNSAWRNGDGGFKFANSTSLLTNNLAVANGAGVSLGSSTHTGNSWNIKSSWSAADLASTDPSILTGPRNPDGSIRSSTFLQPLDYPDLGARS